MHKGDGHFESDKLRAQAKARERIEAQSRIQEAGEAMQVKDGDVQAHRFTDRQGRDLTVALQSKVDSPAGSSRFYKLRDGRQEVGHLDLKLEQSLQRDLQTGEFTRRCDRVKITDVEVKEAYRRAGSGSELLKVAEKEARLHGAKEVYGDPKNGKARAFFEHKQGDGWRFREGGYYGEVYKELPKSSDGNTLRRQLPRS